MRRKHIINTFSKKAEKNWDTLYWAIDIHDTCIAANYKANDIPTEFYPKAKEVLQRLTSRKDCCLILFTCSHPHEIEKYIELFKTHGIEFKFVNENPDAKNTAYGYFEKKFYFNFMLDDKAGFDPNTDWAVINDALDEIDGIETKKLIFPTEDEISKAAQAELDNTFGGEKKNTDWDDLEGIFKNAVKWCINYLNKNK